MIYDLLRVVLKKKQTIEYPSIYQVFLDETVNFYIVFNLIGFKVLETHNSM